MSFQPSVPQATDLISVSQLDLLNNNTQANTIFAVDHVAFDALSNNGKHNMTTMLDQSAGIPASLANEVVVYNFTTGAISSLRYRRDTLATEFTLNPIKAYARVTATGAAGAQTLTAGSNFNVTSVTGIGAGTTIFDVVLSQPMSSASNYSVFNQRNQTVGNSTTTLTSSTTFTITYTGALTAGAVFNFFVMES